MKRLVFIAGLLAASLAAAQIQVVQPGSIATVPSLPDGKFIGDTLRVYNSGSAAQTLIASSKLALLGVGAFVGCRADGGFTDAGACTYIKLTVNANDSVLLFWDGVRWVQPTTPGTALTATPTLNAGFIDAGTVRITSEVDFDPAATGELLPAGVELQFRDHSGNGHWDLLDNTAALGNVDALGIFRTGGSTPYAWWDFNTGYANSRFGFAVSGANDGTDSRGVPVEYPNDGGLTKLQACITDFATMSAGAVTVTFVPAFSGVPVCTCSEIAATPLACGATSTPTASNVALGVSTGASNRIMYTCCGLR